MSYRLIGALLIIAGCGGFGFSMVLEQKKQENTVHRLLSALKFMQWELQYRLTPLPELCIRAGKQGGGLVQKILEQVAAELSSQVLPDVTSCMQKVLLTEQDMPRSIRVLFRKLGVSLGNFDLPGQLEGLQAVEKACQTELKRMENGKVQRFRSYETLGICAGAALVILFI